LRKRSGKEIKKERKMGDDYDDEDNHIKKVLLSRPLKAVPLN